MAKLKLDVVTAESVVYSDEVDVVVAPGSEGELAILPRHAPLLTRLVPGSLRIRKGETETDLAVTGGFLEVQSNRVIVLADAAERAEDIDVARATAALDRAQALLSQKPTSDSQRQDLDRALAAIRRSQVRLRVARRNRPLDRHD